MEKKVRKVYNMDKIYDNGYELLGRVCDIKEYIHKHCDNREEFEEVIEVLEDYTADAIVVIDYDNSIGMVVKYTWNNNDVIMELKESE